MAALATPVTTKTSLADIHYPTSDGKPMGETDVHRNVMAAAIDVLQMFYAGQTVYVSGNILVYYRPGNKRRHVSPDVLVVKGLEPRDRDNYLLWEEGRAPNVVIEVTSESTREEDLQDKFEIYRDEIRVVEYFLFDPRAEYLNPVLQGYRLRRGRYEPIAAVAGRMPSTELGLHLEADGNRLRFYDPVSGRWLPTSQEACLQKDAALEQKDAALGQKDAELERLRQELAALRARD